MITRDFLKMMMDDEHYGKKIEHAFERMYNGNKVSFASCCEKIIEVLETVMKKGYLTFRRYEIMKGILKNAYNNQRCIIISMNNEMLTILNTETDSFDCFSLIDMISWFVVMITTDPLFRKYLKGHYDYAGVINCLEEISSSGSDTCIDLSGAANVVTCGDYLYIAHMDNDEIKLLRMKKRERIDFSFDSKIEEIMLLASAEMFPDPERNCFYVNHFDGRGRKIQFDNGMATIVTGKIVNITDQGDIIVVVGNDLFLVKEGKETVKIGRVENIILNTSETEGVSWIDWDNAELQFRWYTNGIITTSHNLKSDCVWRYILKNGYCYRSNQEKNMSFTLWLHKCCQFPVPFTVKNIQYAIAELETGIIKGYVEKSQEYASIIGSLLALNEEDEEVTDKLFEYYDFQCKDIGYAEVECWKNTRSILSGEKILLGDSMETSFAIVKNDIDSSDKMVDELDPEINQWFEDISAEIDKQIKELEEKEKREKKMGKVPKKAAKNKKKNKKKHKKHEIAEKIIPPIKSQKDSEETEIFDPNMFMEQ